MRRVYSNIDPSKLLYTIIRAIDVNEYRCDLSPDEEFLQFSARSLKKGTIIPAHKHLPVERFINNTQEAWIVFKGSVMGTFYDLDNSIVEHARLDDGDCVVLFRGGHQLEVLTEDTIFYEIKTGPYYGKIYDKEPIK